MDLARALELATDLRPDSPLVADLPLAFTTVPDKTAGDIFTEAMWDTYIRDNMNSGVARMIADSTLGAAVASVTFSSIPATFAHLLLIVSNCRGSAAVSAINGLIQFNGDTAAAYASALLSVSDAGVVAGSVNTTTSTNGGLFPGANATAGRVGSSRVFIPGYASATLQKNVEWAGGAYTSVVGAQYAAGVGNWTAAAAAINSITYLASSGNFNIGTRFTLYGLPA